jgi:hypothetical protein
VDAAGWGSNANRWEALPRRLLARSPRVFGRADPMIIIAHLWSKGFAEVRAFVDTLFGTALIRIRRGEAVNVMAHPSDSQPLSCVASAWRIELRDVINAPHKGSVPTLWRLQDGEFWRLAPVSIRWNATVLAGKCDGIGDIAALDDVRQPRIPPRMCPRGGGIKVARHFLGKNGSSR